MVYLYSTEHEVGVRIDMEKNQAFIRTNGVEKLAEQGSKIVADANIENKEISEVEYAKI